MSGSVSRSNFHFVSSIKVEEESPKAVMIEKQGIVSILGSDCENTKSSSLRRTLSADMSSKKWLAQNGFNFSPMKKIASSEELAISAAHHSSSSSSSSSGQEEYDHQGTNKEVPGQDDVWRSIQSQKQTDVKWSWGTILFEKNEDSSSKLPPPYVHPLVRRSGSSLSEKSLEICTESLGSETGSDGFSSYTSSEEGDVEDEKQNDNQQQQLSQSYEEDLRIVKYSHSYSKKMGPRSFPPPIPSLAREDGASVHMQSHRQNGRLVLEAVSVPSQNYFHAHREDGRLRLSFVNNPSLEDASGGEIGEEVEEFEQVFDNFEEIEGNENNFYDIQGDEGHEEGEEEEEEYEGIEEEYEGIEEEESDNIVEKFEIEQKGSSRKEVEFVIEAENSKLPSGLMHVHKPTIMVKKLMGLDKKNLAWSSRFNKGVNLLEVEEVVGDDHRLNPPLPQSLPPPQRVARLISAQPATTAAASFNAYEYFWRDQKPTMASIIKPISSTEQCPTLNINNQSKVIHLASTTLKGYEHQNLVLMRGNKAEYLVPLLRRSCNDQSKRSLLLWEPYCIAT